VPDATDQLALRRIARNYGVAIGGPAVLVDERGQSALGGIEAEAGFAYVFVRTVALEAPIGEDGSDVEVEIDHLRDVVRNGGCPAPGS
jgi:hypothetical protein